jgi:hypothetical protein
MYGTAWAIIRTKRLGAVMLILRLKVSPSEGGGGTLTADLA